MNERRKNTNDKYHATDAHAHAHTHAYSYTRESEHMYKASIYIESCVFLYDV